ncbi:MAG: hypothetical protein ACRENO_09135 [Thermodesulfobacteriota bacterium]
MGIHNKNKKLLVDWNATLISGVISGVVFYLLNLFLIPYVYGGTYLTVIRYISSVFLGERILPPPATFDLTALIVSLVFIILLSLIFTLIVSYVLHKGGIITGIIGGAIFGVAFYYIFFNSLTLFYPWLYSLKNEMTLINFTILGILSGGLYETFEVEKS